MADNKVSNERAPGTFTLIPVFLYIASLLVGWGITTQWVAQQLAYQPQLGAPLVSLLGYPLYAPWKVLVWNYWYRIYATPLFNRAMLWVFASAFIGILLVVVYAVWQARRARTATTYGSSRWASQKEIAAAGLMSGFGVVLGIGPGRNYLQHDGPENIALIAPPRSGKGVGPIISTLMTWPHSTVVNDIRKENWEASAGYRHRFSNVVYFNPTDPDSAHFNPLFEIRKGLRAIADAQNIADMIVDPDGDGKPSHWDKTSHALLVAAILHVLYAEPDKSLPGVANFLANPARDIFATLTLMLRTPHEDAQVHAAIASAARENLNRSANELSGVMSTAMSFLGLYRDPIICGNVRDSDFRIEDLIYGDKPLSLYIVIPPSEISRTRPLRRLVWAQIGRRLMEDWQSPHPTVSPLRPGVNVVKGEQPAPVKRERRRVLLLVDEFPALGRMDFFETQLAYTGGYGIKTMLIAQSTNQIDKVYGTTNSLLDMCGVRVFFTPNDVETAQTISALTGEKTVVHQQKTYTGHRLAPWLSHVMVADQETGRAVLDVGEVLRFSEHDALIFLSGCFPIRAQKLKYFEDANFKNRMLPPPALTGARPYPYRPKPYLAKWLSVKLPIAVAATASETEALADDDVDVDNAIEPGDLNPSNTEQQRGGTGGAPEIETSTEKTPDPDELKSEQALDNATAMNSNDTALRAAFDAQELARRDRTRHSHEHDHVFDRSI